MSDGAGQRGVDGPLHVALVCFSSLGGSGVVASEIAVGLARRGHRCHLIASAAPSRALPACDRLTFHEVRVPTYPLFEHAPYTLAIASTLIELARAERIDLVHVHYAVPHAASADLARRALGAKAPKLVTTLHGTDVNKVGVDPSYRAVTRSTVAASDGITVPSDALRREARDLLEIPARVPIEVIPNFVDTEHFAPAAARTSDARAHLGRLFPVTAPGDQNAPILFHVSNFRAVKRVPDLVEVLAKIRAEGPARLILVGDGPERANVEAKAVALDVSSSIAWIGKRPEFAEDLRHADAFVLASESESFGVAALEALSSGVPVFAYRVGGLPEVVTDDVGALVAPFDTSALARALLDTLQNPARHAELARSARARALAHFQRGPALDRYEAYYRRVLGGFVNS